MRITKPCAGDDPFKIEGSIEQHELLLSDMSLAPPDKDGKCRRLYNRQGEHSAVAADVSHPVCCPQVYSMLSRPLSDTVCGQCINDAKLTVM
jgi:hypothetical protein